MPKSFMHRSILAVCIPALVASAADLPALKVSEIRHFLIQADESPFFWLGDTAWELFHRPNREQASPYLKDRAAKGFTVIQAVGLAELDGLHHLLNDINIFFGPPHWNRAHDDSPFLGGNYGYQYQQVASTR